MTTTLYTRCPAGWLLIVCCLCLCVMVQMLGVPATLLSPADSPDLLGSSVLEGFSILPPSPDMSLPATSAAAPDFSSLSHVPVMVSAVFHPPVR
ncbi:MAG: hypothetical protein H8K08_01700 [Nitrospira sp.]|nr:hypothetical protein [Nitrospira sp.]